MRPSEHFRIFGRGIRLLYEMSPAYTVLFMLETLVSAVTPYVPIWSSARLIDAIAAGRPLRTLALYAALTVGLTFLMKLLSAALVWRRDVGSDELGYNAEWRYAEKVMDMAYKNVEDRDTALLRERIRKETQTGYNYWYLETGAAELIRFTAQIAASIALTASFFGVKSIPLWMKLALVGGVLLTLLAGMLLRSRSERILKVFFDRLVDTNIRSEKLGSFIRGIPTARTSGSTAWRRTWRRGPSGSETSFAGRSPERTSPQASSIPWGRRSTTASDTAFI